MKTGKRPESPHGAIPIDESILPLVEALNGMPGIDTVGSCGGDAEPISGGSWPLGSWYVKVRIEQNPVGWRTLEFLSWVINHDAHNGEDPSKVWLVPTSVPPYLNTPGEMLTFTIECHDDESDSAKDWSRWLTEVFADLYVPVDPVRRRIGLKGT